MATRNEIQTEVQQSADKVRRRFLADLHKHTKRNTILYASAYATQKQSGIPSWVLSVTLQDIQGFMAAIKGMTGKDLDLILHSPGGSLDAAEQIVQYLRSKFDHIRAIVPQNAMSAATMLACACDEVVMGKQSALGPIDPQLTVPAANGPITVAAQTLLDEFNFAAKQVAANPALVPLWATKLREYPPGILANCQTTISLSIEKVRTWLTSYMFKNDSDGPKKADSIAKWLGDATHHKTHGRPLGISELSGQGLKISTLESDNTLQDLVLSVFHASTVTMETTSCVKIIENHFGRGIYLKTA